MTRPVRCHPRCASAITRACSRAASRNCCKDAKQDDVCDKCADERKNKPVLGLEIIRGAKKSDGKEVWEGGKILDPDNGKAVSYTHLRAHETKANLVCRL